MTTHTSQVDISTADHLPRCTPESEGVASDAILAFLETVAEKGQELHSLMLVRRGSVLAEGWWKPYTPEAPHMLYSLSKSFLSTAAGLAIAEGYFSLSDAVTNFFPDDLPETVSENLQAMQVKHLLTMTTGHAEDQTGNLRSDPDGNWARAFLAQAVEHAPGTFFRYNSAATYMVSAILQKTTGMTALAFLTPRLLEPLGIRDATWETDPRGISVGGWGLKLRTDEIARFGELYRRRGYWIDRSLIPADWVDSATRAEVSNGSDPDSDWAQGYGYQFWRCRHGAYRADGAFGQLCIVMPKQEAVLVLTANLNDFQALLNPVWEILLSAMSPAASIPEKPDAIARLRERLTDLSLARPEGKATSPTAAAVSGRVYTFGKNDQEIRSARFEFADDRVTLTIEDAGGSHQIRSGLRDWHAGNTTFLQRRIVRAVPQGNDAHAGEAASAVAAWTDDHTLVLRLCLTETPFTPTLHCRFAGENSLHLQIQGRIGFDSGERPVLEGTA